LGDALVRLGDTEQAIAPLREAVGKWPDDDQVRRRLALAYAVTLQPTGARIEAVSRLPGTTTRSRPLSRT